MARTNSDSVTDVPCTCGFLQDRAADASSPIKFDANSNEFRFQYVGSRGQGCSIPIYHCSFCGGAAPQSQKDHLFAVISSDEEHRLFAVLKDVRTVDDAMTVLGPPDSDLADGSGFRLLESLGSAPESTHFRNLIYTRLSSVANVRLTVYPAGNVHASLQGKYIGPKRG